MAAIPQRQYRHLTGLTTRLSGALHTVVNGVPLGGLETDLVLVLYYYTPTLDTLLAQ